jgi:hypothetical protein
VGMGDAGSMIGMDEGRYGQHTNPSTGGDR